MSHGPAGGPVRAMTTDVSPQRRAALDAKALRAREKYWADPEQARRQGREERAAWTPEQLAQSREYQNRHYAEKRDAIRDRKATKAAIERLEAIRAYGGQCACGETNPHQLYLRSTAPTPVVPPGMVLVTATTTIISRLRAEDWPPGVLEVVCRTCTARAAGARVAAQVTEEEKQRRAARDRATDQRNNALEAERAKARRKKAAARYRADRPCCQTATRPYIIDPSCAGKVTNTRLRHLEREGWPAGALEAVCGRCRPHIQQRITS